MWEAGASLYAVGCSRHQLQGGAESSLFDDCALSKPRGVHAVLVAARPAFMIDVLRHCVEQAPGGAFSGFQLGAATLPLEHVQHLV
ncbi:hypothetical protein D3C84_1001770 [compost metagenome]